MKAIHLNEISEVRIHKVSAEAVSSAVVISLSGAMILSVRHLPDYWPTEPWHVAALSGGIAVLSLLHECLHAFALMSAARLTPSIFVSAPCRRR
jgi:hypothetical protein